MTRLLDLDLEEGGSILVEVAEPPREEVTRGGRGRVDVEKAASTLEEVLARLGPANRAIISQLRALADAPEEIEVEFGVKLNADANVVIARTGAEANFRILLKWGRRGQA